MHLWFKITNNLINDFAWVVRNIARHNLGSIFSSSEEHVGYDFALSH